VTTTLQSPVPPAPEPAKADAGALAERTATGWKLTLKEFTSNKLAMVGIGILVFFILFCFLGPYVYHSQQSVTNLDNIDQGPQTGNPLGTDDNGFDVLGRIMLGGQTSLEIGFLAAFIASFIGTLWGAVAGLVGGAVDAVMMRVVDVMLSVPFLLVVLIIAHVYGSNLWNLSLIIGIFSWLVPARLVRGEVLTLRVRDFVSAARVMGAGNSRLIYRHLLPNALGTVIVNITFQIADAVLVLSTLGFLGFGIKYPGTDWGSQLGNAQDSLTAGYWWLVYPVGLCLVLVVMAFNLIGDGLRDAVDVRLRKR
jgi:ABC-type dipeptide/oligopeptide/nickel transport system permease subunit